MERLLRFVADAESLGGEEPFTPELLHELGTIVQADWIGYNELDCVRRREHLIVERPGNAFEDELTEEGWVLLEEHPICQAHERGDFRTLKLSDFLTRRELLGSQFYNEWLRPYDIEHELELAIPSPQWHTRTFVFDRVGRGSRDFSERDRLALDLLKPHLTRWWEKAAERKRQAAEEGDAAILTTREREVLSWVARGKTNPQIAEILWLSPGTVRKHLENVYEKLEVNTRTAAVARFLGLVDGQEPDTVPASVQR